jgi:hypothetical protein
VRNEDQSKSVHTGHRNEFVRVYSVPIGETVYVRFLSDYSGILTHRRGERGYACPGADSCERSLHRNGTIWKGYAAAEMWIPGNPGIWRTITLEITERLAELLPADGLRGQVWELNRCQTGKGKSEVTGVQNSVHDDSELRPAFDFRAPVCRVYHTTEIAWNALPPMPSRVTREESVGTPPIIKIDVTPQSQKPLSAAEMKEQIARAKAVLSGRGKEDHRG